MQDFNTIFLSIVIEALPLVLLGVFVSSFIHSFVPPEWIQRALPKQRLTGIVAACLLGLFIPLCECGMVPIIRRLISKGVPPYIAIAFMLSAPIINPLVAWSTYLAFSGFPPMVFYRLTGAFIAVVIIGFLVSATQRRPVLCASEAAAANCCGHHAHKAPNSTPGFMNALREMLYHACDDFFAMGRFLLLGSFLAALIQVTIPRLTLLSFGQDSVYSIGGMMLFAFLISVCSQADAFIAAPFLEHFSTASLAAFLIFGPMLDIKNTLMLFTIFKPLFTLKLILIITATVFAVSLSMAYFPQLWEVICFVPA
ncbi:permease [Sporomusa sphaeroides]|uniref:Permease n=1 Tax=Sporomusa sphaeroides DSM 2875 TaxID=1337886 RepID=A0ABM9W099_9FIRM|nr:permease [Sporomusa sphaeroides]OLS57083.1 putative two-component membrane permease complex subunit [Sporomusa sphaeroides DSM 2875]CVK18269.1 putative permease [Sporomusa sphaeroides DSM 2875]